MPDLRCPHLPAGSIDMDKLQEGAAKAKSEADLAAAIEKARVVPPKKEKPKPDEAKAASPAPSPAPSPTPAPKPSGNAG